jgi:hypothetical protein
MGTSVKGSFLLLLVRVWDSMVLAWESRDISFARMVKYVIKTELFYTKRQLSSKTPALLRTTMLRSRAKRTRTLCSLEVRIR